MRIVSRVPLRHEDTVIGECDICERHRELTFTRGQNGYEVYACWECRGDEEPDYDDELDFASLIATYR